MYFQNLHEPDISQTFITPVFIIIMMFEFGWLCNAAENLSEEVSIYLELLFWDFRIALSKFSFRHMKLAHFRIIMHEKKKAAQAKTRDQKSLNYPLFNYTHKFSRGF